jgi:hypothetical protein
MPSPNGVVVSGNGKARLGKTLGANHGVGWGQPIEVKAKPCVELKCIVKVQVFIIISTIF